MSRTTRNRLSAVILGLGLVTAPFAGRAPAQMAGDRTGIDTGTTATRTTRDDRGFDMSWLGLLGLAGLAGLMPRKNHVVATHRAGDTAGR